MCTHIYTYVACTYVLMYMYTSKYMFVYICISLHVNTGPANSLYYYFLFNSPDNIKLFILNKVLTILNFIQFMFLIIYLGRLWN